jgi:hypothetical protein
MSEMLQHFLHQRGVDDPCETCHGYGVKSYANTSTWRGGMGGNMITRDICSSCWGSGDKYRPWLDLRSLNNQQKAWEENQCLSYLAQRIGANLTVLNMRIKDLAEYCHKQANKRKIPEGEEAFWWHQNWYALGNILGNLGPGRKD